ncbi:MAG: C-terminal binding protein [Tagaea sp.]|nr:C-terminal binding protein [Tagaea sp.]
MKAVLPYDASPGVRRQIAALDPAIVRAVVLAEADAEALRRELADADVLLHVLAPVTAAILDAAPSLKLVQKIGVGVDTIDRAAARARGIAVCNMPGTNTVAVAELTLSLIFATLRRVAALDADLRAGAGWPAAATHLDAAGELDGATVGLIGYGAVARRLRPALTALGARVVVHSRTPPDDGALSVSLDELLAAADVVSLHVPATEATRGLLDARRIARMKPGAILINTARGALVDEAALVVALADGKLAGAGLDVFAREPLAPGHPLVGLGNVVLTPHVAWMTPGTWRRSLAVVTENCRRLRAGEALLHRVDGVAA